MPGKRNVYTMTTSSLVQEDGEQPDNEADHRDEQSQGDELDYDRDEANNDYREQDGEDDEQIHELPPALEYTDPTIPIHFHRQGTKWNYIWFPIRKLDLTIEMRDLPNSVCGEPDVCLRGYLTPTLNP
jgi:hypothetical protein